MILILFVFMLTGIILYRKGFNSGLHSGKCQVLRENLIRGDYSTKDIEFEQTLNHLAIAAETYDKHHKKVKAVRIKHQEPNQIPLSKAV